MKGHIIFGTTVALLAVVVISGFVFLDELNRALPNWVVWLLFKTVSRIALPLMIIGWLAYLVNQLTRRAGQQSAEFLKEPHMMMHLGYTIVPLPIGGGTGSADVNGFHEHIHENEERQDNFRGVWMDVFWHAHEVAHEWMEANPEDVQGYTQAVNWQRIKDQIAEPDFTYGPAKRPPRPDPQRIEE